MSTRTYSYAIGAGETVVAPGGLFFYIKAATAALNITTRGNPTSPIEFVGVGAGLKFGPVGPDKAWRYLDMYSATAQTVVLILSDDAEVDIASTVTVAGNVTTSDLPSTSLASPAPDVIANASALVIAANLARRRLTIAALAANTGSVFVQSTGAGAGRGVEIQPGMSYGLDSTAAIDVRNDSGASQTVTRLEET